MQKCRQCGGYIAAGWNTCKICGFDPSSAPPVHLPPPQGSWSAGGSGRPPAGGGARSGPPAWLLPVVSAVAVVAVAVAGFLLLQDDDGSGASGDTTTTSTEPERDEDDDGGDGPASDGPTSAEYVAAIRFANERDITMSEAAWTCAGTATVDALGGAERLADLGIDPGVFAGDGGIDGTAVPPGAVDQIASRLLTCGVDFGVIAHDHLVETSALNPELVACFEANVDRVITARDLAAQFLGEDAASEPRQAWFRHTSDLARACT